MRRAAPGVPIPTSPHTEKIHAVACPLCGAGFGLPCSEQGSTGPYVVAPHPSRVAAAGFRIVPHPTDDGVRWYEEVTS